MHLNTVWDVVIVDKAANYLLGDFGFCCVPLEIVIPCYGGMQNLKSNMAETDEPWAIIQFLRT